MSLQFAGAEFFECPGCSRRPGSPELCKQCLERRELHGVIAKLRTMFPISKAGSVALIMAGEIANLVAVCPTCNGAPNPRCEEHGR